MWVAAKQMTVTMLAVLVVFFALALLNFVLLCKFRQPSAQFEGSTSQLPEEKAYSKDEFAWPITFSQFVVMGHRCFEGSIWPLGCLKMCMCVLLSPFGLLIFAFSLPGAVGFASRGSRFRGHGMFLSALWAGAR